jgi:hypothetical protein
MSIEELCQQFYDSEIFHPTISGRDVWSSFLTTVLDSVAEPDRSFSAIDAAAFEQEMTALRIELFGLAWMHHWREERLLLPEITFTKRYLELNRKPEIWHAMLDYNRAIARSQDAIPQGPHRFTVQEAYITFRNRLRSEFLAKSMKARVDPEYAARAANRISTDATWSDSPGIEMLAATLMQRLGYQPNSEGCFRLEAAISGLYKSARKYIKAASAQVMLPTIT